MESDVWSILIEWKEKRREEQNFSTHFQKHITYEVYKHIKPLQSHFMIAASFPFLTRI